MSLVSLSELRKMLAIIWPVVFGLMFQMSLSIVNLVFVGRKANNTDEFAAIGLALSFTNVFGQSVGQGLATACDTLCSQAYGGPNKKLVGLAVQRGLWILSLGCMCCWCIWLNAKPILSVLGMKPRVIDLTSEYCLYAMPMLPGNFLYTLLQKYLQAQGKVLPGMIVAGVVCALNVLVNYILQDVMDLGILGSALALDIANISLGLFLLGYILIFNLHEKTWPGWSRESFLEWDVFTRLAIPGMAMLCLEWWAFEAIQFFAAKLGETELASQLVVGQIMAFNIMIPFGISIAGSVRVGNLLGSNNPTGARHAFTTSVIVDFCVVSTTSMTIFALRKYLVNAIINDPSVAEVAADILMLVPFFQILDSVQLILSGALRGCGRQKIGAVINLCGYYLIAIPMAILFAFHLGYGLRGLWYGMFMGTFSQNFNLFMTVLRQDWSEQARLALARSKVDTSKVNVFEDNDVDDEPLLDLSTAVVLSGGQREEHNLDWVLADVGILDQLDVVLSEKHAQEDHEKGALLSATPSPTLSTRVIAKRVGVFSFCALLLVVSFLVRQVWDK